MLLLCVGCEFFIDGNLGTKIWGPDVRFLFLCDNSKELIQKKVALYDISIKRKRQDKNIHVSSSKERGQNRVQSST